MPLRTPLCARAFPRTAAALIAVALLGLLPAAPAGAATAPPGWRLVASEALGPGVDHQTLRSDDPAEDVHVARLAPGTAARLVPVLSHDALTAGLEPTSSMCARVRCVAAVNGDYFDPAGQPIGATVAAGELMASPAADHILLRIDGQGRATLRPGIDWTVVVATADGRALGIQAVNRPLTGDGISLYSRRWGPSTATTPGTTEVPLQLVAGGVLPSGDSAVQVGPPTTTGNAAIAPGAVVLSARAGTTGAGTLADLAARAAGVATLRVNLGGTVTAIGGSPQLLQNGQLDYPADNPDDFTQGRHPRTLVGLTPAGEILLVTADKGATSAGLTLAEATRLLTGLGATDGLNLDGGGSTTFVGNGTVRNHPGDGQERPVASALAVLPAGPLDGVTALLNQVNATVNALLQPPK
jgi:hypothetical protein